MICKTWSKSSYALFKLCPFAYHMFKELKREQPFSPKMSHGKWVHSNREKVCLGEKELSDALENAPTKEAAAALERLVQEDPLLDYQKSLEYEQRILVGRTGRPVTTWDGATHVMIIDRLGLVDDVLEVDDVKFVHPLFEHEFLAEIQAYAYAALLRYPKCKTVRFRYLFAKSGNIVTYEFAQKEVKGFWKNLKEYRQEILDAEPVPTPGDHCERWFGTGSCQFAGNECPIAIESLPAVVEGAPPTSIEVKRLSLDKAAPSAFMGVLHGLIKPDEIDGEIASLVWTADNQIREGRAKVKKILKSAMAERDFSFPYGTSTYGLAEGESISLFGEGLDGRAAALEIMLEAGWSPQKIAKYIRMDTDSFRRPLPGDERICEDILEQCVEPNGRWTIKQI